MLIFRIFLCNLVLTLKAPITAAADDSLKISHCFPEKIRLDISCESSAMQRIHMKCEALFSLKDKIDKKIIKLSSAAILLGSLRVNRSHFMIVLFII